MGNRVVLLLLSLCITLCLGQYLNNPKRVYTTPVGVNLKAVGAAITTCSDTLVLLDDTTDCMKFADKEGVVYDTLCTPDLADAHELYAYASAGYVLNANGKFVIFDMYTSDIIDVIGPQQTMVNNPWMVGLYTGFAEPTLGHTMILLDGAINSTAYLPNWTINGTGANTYSSGLIIALENVKPVLCVFSSQGGSFFIVYEGDPIIYRYAWSTSANPRILGQWDGGFGDIGACGSDFYNRGWVWDRTSNSIKIFNYNYANNNVTAPGVILMEQPLTGLVNPRRINPTRNKVFIHDDIGVMRYDLEPLKVQFTAPVNKSCSTAQFGFTVTGGSPIYQARVIPDFVTASTSDARAWGFNYNATVTYSNNTYQPFVLYDDQVALEYESYKSSTTPADALTTSSTITHSGTSSLSMLMAGRYSYGIRTSSTITGGSLSARFFSNLTMWVYVSSGVGKFKIDLNPSATFAGKTYVYSTYGPSDIPRDVWTQINFDLARSPVANGVFNNIMFIDQSNSTATNAFIYVDDIVLTPYSSTDRVLMVRDYCNATVFSDPIPIGNTANFMQSKMVSPSVSCNAAGATGNKASDATLFSNITGGVGPYSYLWTLNNQNKSSITNAPSTDNYFVIYDNALAPEFVDQSNTDHNVADTTYAYSGPNSLSFEPAGDLFLSDLIFFIPTGISYSKYQAVEFWVNGGDVGKQILRVGMLNAQLALTGDQYVHRAAGIPMLLPKTWTKVQYNIPSATAAYYGFVITGVIGKPQPRAYFDEIRFISTAQTLTVTDSLNCKITVPVFVLAPRPLTVVPTVSNVKCFDSSDGAISLKVAGGTAPYKLRWVDNGTLDASKPLTGLTEASYLFSVYDQNNCTTIPLTTSATLRRPPAMQITTSISNALCYGNRGSIIAQVSGGVTPYFFRWTSPSRSSFDALALEAPFAVFTDTFQNSFALSTTQRSYTTTVCRGADNDSSHTGYCSLSVDPPATGVDVSVFSVGCPNCIDFSQYTSIKLWVKLENVNDFNGLHAVFSKDNTSLYDQPLFNYTVTSTDWQQVIITFPVTEGAIADYFTIVCINSNTQGFLLDSISLIPVGTFSKGVNVHSGFIAHVQGRGGSYQLSLVDSNACPIVTDFELVEPPMLAVDIEHSGTNSSLAEGTLLASASGGVPPYSYYWPELDVRSDSVHNLDAGSYLLVITDANGCSLNNSAVLPLSSRGRITRKYTPGVATGFGIIAGLGVILATVSLIILITKWNHFAHYGPFYCGIINVGVIVAMISVAVILPEPTDALCLAFPWFLGIGFTLVYGCLFIKTWVLYRVFRQATQLKKTKLTPFYILKVLSVFLCIEIVFMIIWSVVDPPKAGYANLVDNRKEMQCTNDTDVFWIIFLSIKGGWIIFGAVLAFLTRNITEEYNTSKSIAYAIYNDIVLIVIGVILAMTLDEVPGGVVVVEAAIVFLSFTFTLLILFFPVWWKIYFSSVDLGEVKLPPMKSSGNTGTNSSGGSGNNQSKKASGGDSSSSSNMTPSATAGAFSAQSVYAL